MPKLENAPLIDVEFKIWWHLNSFDDVKRVQFLLGDFHKEIEQNFPIREIISDASIFRHGHYSDIPTHLFKKRDKDFPQVRMSETTMTINSTDNEYQWSDFSDLVDETTSVLVKVLKRLINPNHFHLELMYVDFIPFDLNATSLLDDLQKNLGTQIKVNYFTQSIDEARLYFESAVSSGTKIVTFEVDENEGETGWIVKTIIESDIITPSSESILHWLEKAHSECSKTFKSMIGSELKEKFK